MTWETEELSILPPSCKVTFHLFPGLLYALHKKLPFLLLVTMGTSLFLTFLAGNVCSLQSLGLGGNDIHDEGAIHLAQALKTNTRLCSLGLGGNQIGRNIMLLSLYYENLFEMLLFIADEGGKAIADMLRLNQTLRKLLLSSNLLGELTCSNNYCDKVPMHCSPSPLIPIR